MSDRLDVSALLRPAIYFLYWKGEVVYVGQSVSPLKRIYTHASLKERRRKQEPYTKTKPVLFDRVEIQPAPIERLSAEEKAWIAHYKPKWNIHHKKAPMVKLDLVAMLSLSGPKEVVIKRRL